MRFTIPLHLRVPPEYLVEWWLDYSPSDAALSSSILQRQVTQETDGAVHLLTLGSHGRHTTRTDATVRRTGPFGFQEVGEMDIDGEHAAFVTVDYSVQGDPDGSQLTARFEFRPRTLKYRLSFLFATARFRRERDGAFREFGRSLSDQYARHEPARAMPSV